MKNNIKKLVDALGKNPHWLSRETGLTYRIVLRLYREDELPQTTPIGTLDPIARVLGVRVDDLYQMTAR